MTELPEGLRWRDQYPALLAELMRRGWNDADIAKLAGGNALRVLGAAKGRPIDARYAARNGRHCSGGKAGPAISRC